MWSILCSASDLGSQGFGDLLATIRSRNIPLQNMHFVVRIFRISSFPGFNNVKMLLVSLIISLSSFQLQTYRNNLNKVISDSLY